MAEVASSRARSDLNRISRAQDTAGSDRRALREGPHS
jgi:hypothetical protein